MIAYLPFDIAFGYDALSILVVKQRSGATDAIMDSIELMDEALSRQVGAAKHDAILCSREYARMIEVNQQLFNAFEWLHTKAPHAESLLVASQAMQTDRMNGVDRPAAKRALQERWFAGEPITEQKIGYGTLEGVLTASTARAEHDHAP